MHGEIGVVKVSTMEYQELFESKVRLDLIREFLESGDFVATPDLKRLAGIKDEKGEIENADITAE